ncbi:MAG: dihydroneopterin aldolase [Dehalococcoidia bacterium]
MNSEEMDCIRIDGLLIHCIVGINDWERLAPQEIRLNIALYANLRAAGRSDAIDDTIDYRTVAKRVIAGVEGSSFGLVEALADYVARVCLEDPRVEKVEVSLQKPGALRTAKCVGVDITRRREQL